MLEVIKKPLVSEKNARLTQDENAYCFKVSLKAKKEDIGKAVEEAFNVKVESVRTMVCRGKYFRKRAKVGPPKKWKKAIVRVKAGEKINLFEGV